ncbi:MAG TPA: nitrilase-related carbon-nitrogen hydrolase [Verrucomicrobiae bacterium]
MTTAPIAIQEAKQPLAKAAEGLRPVSIAAWGVIAVVSLHAAYGWPNAGFLVLVYLFAVLQMAKARTWRQAFYPGLAVGLLIGLLRLDFFWRIFSTGAFALWIVFAFWIGLFVALARISLRWPVLRMGSFDLTWVLIPFIWFGVEYFRSELYYLRFAWLSPGFAFGESPGWVPLHAVGTYGLGFLLMCVACAAAGFWRRSKWQAAAILLGGAAALRLGGAVTAKIPTGTGSLVHVAGIQMEFPTEKEVLVRLNDLLRKQPTAELIVLSEYTFSEPVPKEIRDWCREHRRYLVVGGKDPLGKGQFYNTAFVISPEGEIIFRQVKSVPIQFFKDGLPGQEQKIWHSPWGKIGICICYDLGYSRVTDRLVQLGAEALIVPTMDVVDWGERQHRLHARVAPVRAAEYGIPVFRVASSGISQLVDGRGNVLASAPCPGDGAVIAGTLDFRGPGRLPWDRWLAPLALVVTLGLIFIGCWKQLRAKRSKKSLNL